MKKVIKVLQLIMPMIFKILKNNDKDGCVRAICTLHSNGTFVCRANATLDLMNRSFLLVYSSPRGSIYLNRLSWLEDRYFNTSLTLIPVYWHYEHGSFTPFTLVYQSVSLLIMG